MNTNNRCMCLSDQVKIDDQESGAPHAVLNADGLGLYDSSTNTEIAHFNNTNDDTAYAPVATGALTTLGGAYIGRQLVVISDTTLGGALNLYGHITLPPLTTRYQIHDLTPGITVESLGASAAIRSAYGPVGMMAWDYINGGNSAVEVDFVLPENLYPDTPLELHFVMSKNAAATGTAQFLLEHNTVHPGVDAVSGPVVPVAIPFAFPLATTLAAEGTTNIVIPTAVCVPRSTCHITFSRVAPGDTLATPVFLHSLFVRYRVNGLFANAL